MMYKAVSKYLVADIHPGRCVKKEFIVDEHATKIFEGVIVCSYRIKPRGTQFVVAFDDGDVLELSKSDLGFIGAFYNFSL